MIDIGKDLQQAFEDGYKKGFADGQSQPTIQPQGIDKDRLIEELTELGWIDDNPENSFGIIKDIIDQQPTSDGWIPVSDAVDISYLHDWYISSVMDDEPVWTEKHLEELFNDFILIPKPLPQPYKESGSCNNCNDHKESE